MKNVSGIYRMELLLPIPTWNPSARCVFAGNERNWTSIRSASRVFQEPCVDNLNMQDDLFIKSGAFRPVFCVLCFAAVFAGLGRSFSLPVQGHGADEETGL